MNFMKNRKEDVIFVSVLIALVLIFVIFKVVKGDKVEAPVVETAPTTLSADQVEAPKIVAVKKKKVVSIIPELSYANEFVKYKDGRLVQFTSECQVSRPSMVIVSGSSIMLDNRSNAEQVITLGDKKYTLPAYDFEILTLTAPVVPTTYFVSCNDRKNVATLIVE